MDKLGLQLAAAAVMPTLRENGIYELGLRMIFSQFMSLILVNNTYK